jgi:hypothetical protein
MPNGQDVDEQLERIAVVKENPVMAPDAAFLQEERLGSQALENLRALPNATGKRFDKPTELTRDQHCAEQPGLSVLKRIAEIEAASGSYFRSRKASRVLSARA